MKGSLMSKECGDTNYYLSEEGKKCEFSELKGKVLKSVNGEKGDTEVVFVTRDGETYKLIHFQECCEDVSVEDICGNFKDIIGSPIVMAEEVNNATPDNWECPEHVDSYTWTFYKLATVKGYVTIRWYGESNGCYSESVDFVKTIRRSNRKE